MKEGEKRRLALTCLTIGLRPASPPEMAIDGGLGAEGLALRRAGTHVSTLPLVLIGHDEVVLH